MDTDTGRRALLAVALLALLCAAAPAAAAQDPPSPGARLGGVVDVQGATVDATVAATGLERRLRALPADRRRRVVERRLDELERRLGALNRSGSALDRDASPRRVARFVGDLRRVERALAVLSDAELSPNLQERVSSLRSRLEDARSAAGTRTLARLQGRPGRGLDRLTRSEVATAVSRGLRAAPDGLYRIVAGERVELRLREGDGSTATFHGTIGDRSLHEQGSGPIDDATLRVEASAATFRRIRSADDPAAVLRAALDDGDVSYRGVGATGRAKYGAVDVVRFGATSVGAFLDRLDSAARVLII